MRHTLSFFVVLACIGTTQAAFAQPVDSPLAAEDLFQRGTALMTAQAYTEACPMLAESYRLDPAGGTLQNLAVCYERQGKWASAYTRFQELRAMSIQALPPRVDRIRLADEHIAINTPRLSRIVVDVPKSRPEGFVVKLDGVAYGEPSWSAGIVVDPGQHELLISAPARVAHRTTVAITEDGTTRHVSVPLLAPIAPPPPAARPNESTTRVHHDENEAKASPNVQRAIGFVVAGIGVVGLGFGAGFGLDAKSKNDEARRDHCSAVACSSRGGTLIDEASASATASTWLFVGGAAALAGGLVLVFTAPKHGIRTSMRGTMFELGGTF